MIEKRTNEFGKGYIEILCMVIGIPSGSDGTASAPIWETWVWPLHWEDPLEKRIATHSSILAWGIPWTEEPGGLQSMGSQRVEHDWATHTHTPMIIAAAAKSLQSCPTLCDPIDSSPPGSPVPGILQAITLEWVAIAFSNAWKWKVKGTVCRFFDDGQSDWCEVMPHCGFSLHFSNN